MLFGSVPKSMVTLLALSTYDAAVVEVMRPIGTVAPVTWIFFAAYLVVVSIGMLELLTAVFVDTLSEERRKEKNLQLEVSSPLPFLFLFGCC